jgi:phosphatidylglycerophosphatase C
MNLALFDFDGTITSADTWTPFLKFAVSPSRMVVGFLLFVPVMVGHRLRVVPTPRARQLANWIAFTGGRSTSVRERGIRYAIEVLPGTLRPAMIERIEWHKSRGDDVVVVSASLDVYLQPWCEARNLPYLCTTLEERAGRLTGRCVRGDCSGAEKARRIKERFDLNQYTLVYAYGDSAEDREMLELAHRQYYRGAVISSNDACQFADLRRRWRKREL